MNVRRAPRLAAFALAAFALAAGATRVRGAGATRVRGAAPETAPVTQLDGVPYVSGRDFAHLIGATRYWRADLRRLSLRAGVHQIQVVVDDPFVLLDDRTIRLDHPVRSLRGEVQLPVALADSLPRDTTLARLVYDPRRAWVASAPAGGVVGAPKRALTGAGERWTFPFERCRGATVVGRGRTHFRVRFDGYFAGALPDSLDPDGAVLAVRALDAASGSVLEFALDPEVRGYRLNASASGATLEFAREAGAGLEPFAPEGEPGPRRLRVVVLDPGHGGDDPGAGDGGLIEKDVTLAVARALRPELERRLGARVVLTRDADVALPQEKRAEAANRAGADLVLSLHADGSPLAAARGVSAWCAPAVWAEESSRAALRPAVEVLAWRDAGLRHAVPSRALAEALLGALDLHGYGPTRVHESLPYPLLGVNAPGVLLECGMLTSAADRARFEPAALGAFVSAIAEGVEAWRRNE